MSSELRLGGLPGAPPEVRLSATLFLLLLGVANLFGAWQVRDFASFAPGEVARMVAPRQPHAMAMECCDFTAIQEKPVDPNTLDRPERWIDRSLLVQDTHVHVPVYAITSALLALIVFGLRLSSRARCGLVVLVFAAPALDFAGLWGAHVAPGWGAFFGATAVAGGIAMGIGYLIILVLLAVQLWFFRGEKYA
jgi:hypothetical protein